jgi:membrane fusion protein (multidrug efflux system)
MSESTLLKLRFLALLASFAILLSSLACGTAEPQSPPPEKAGLPAVAVSITEIQPSDLIERIVLAGRLEPWVEVHVATELGGTVEFIGFEKGNRVAEGDLLARISSELHAAALAEAEADLADAEAQFTKTRELFERQAVPRQDLISATSRHEAAKARANQLRVRHQRSLIKAPIAGVAVTREVERGEVVQPGASIATLHETGRLKAVVGIPDNDIAFFGRGGEATLQVDAYPEKDFSARIHFLGPAASDKTRTFPTELEVANSRGELRPGMIARVSLVKRRLSQVVVVRRDALVDRDQGLVAVVMEGGEARVRPVVVGPQEGNRVVVLEGLSFGEKLVVTGQRELVDGQPLKPVVEN